MFLSLFTSNVLKKVAEKYLGLVVLLIGCAHASYADLVETLPNFTELPGSNNIDGFERNGGVTTFLSRVIEKGLDITAMTAVIAVCIVGVMLITARGDTEKVQKAMKYLGVIILGMVIALTAYAVIAIIDKLPNTFRFF